MTPPPPPMGEVFRIDLQPTYHPHRPLWGTEFSLAPVPKPNQSAPKRAKLLVMDLWLQAKGEQSTPPTTGEVCVFFPVPVAPPPPPPEAALFW